MKKLGSTLYRSLCHYASRASIVPLAALTGILAAAAEVPVTCGSHPERGAEELFLSGQSARARAAQRTPQAVTVRRMQGDIALLDTASGVVGIRNDFDLERRGVRFAPVPGLAGYTIALLPGSGPAGLTGDPLPLGDDDTRRIPLPFAFPFFGAVHREVWVNSDGNLTFEEGDGSSTARSAGQLAGGPPRIAALYRDLDPSVGGQVRVAASAQRLTVSWDQVPDFRSAGIGPRQTFELRLFPDGRIEFEYFTVSTDAALVGLSPGAGRGGLDLIDLDEAGSRVFRRAVAERFERDPQIDVVRAAQRSLEALGDAYDYLVFFNDFGLRPGNALAFQTPVRVTGSGYGLPPLDLGRPYGSPRRLQSVVNMGPIQQYPVDPERPLPGRASAGDNVLTILGHELGHQYLAFTSLPGLLGRQAAHWSFFFDSDASLLEGNRWTDRGEDARPRFISIGAVAGYSALDRYLMGLGPLNEVPDSFFIRPFFAPFLPSSAPAPGAAVDGQRVDVSARQIPERFGRRTPDHTVAQNHFRVAFVLIHRTGAEPSAAAVAQVENYRRAFAEYFPRATQNRATIDLRLREPVQLSLAPAAGIVVGETARAAIEVPTPRPLPLVFRLRVEGAAAAPETVTVPAGATRVDFAVRGLVNGPATLIAEPSGDVAEVTQARLIVSPRAALRLTSRRDGSRWEVRVTDENELPYPGLHLQARVAGIGTITPAAAETDLSGRVVFTGEIRAGDLEVGLAGVEPIRISGAPLVASVLNAASLDERLAPGVLASVFGAGLGGRSTVVRVADRQATVVRGDSGQLLIALPEVPAGPAAIEVMTGQGSARRHAQILPLAPAIFVDASSNRGAVSAAGVVRDFLAGEAVEVYATGLSPDRTTEVTVDGAPAEILFQGPFPGVPGLWQLNLRIPAGISSGLRPLRISVGGSPSNPVVIGIAGRP